MGFTFCITSLFSPDACDAQCTAVFQRSIPDNTTSQFFVEISGAAFNQLGINGQGLCGVRIRFDHPNVSDLRLELLSPSGQKITLIGEPGGGFATNGSNWDITFLPCSGTPLPDIGLLPKWANNANWQKNTSYTGSYFPYTGNCLEQFTSGSVNGLWTVQITDDNALDVGSIKEIELIFCKPTGINCSGCFKTAGIIRDTTIEACEQSIDLNLTLTPDFRYGGNGNGTTYAWVIGNNDRVVRISNVPDLRNFTAGTYTVYGFAYSSADSSRLPLADGTIDINTWRNQYFKGHPSICGDVTLQKATVIIRPNTHTQKIIEFICQNNPIKIQDSIITKPGFYVFKYQNSYGCDSIFEYTVRPVNFQANLTSSGLLSCSAPVATISVNAIDPPTGTTYTWYTISGHIIGPTNDEHIEVDYPATYYVVLEKLGCRDTISMVVNQDNSLPKVNVQAAVLDCNHRMVKIHVTTNTSLVSISWKGPGGYTSDLADPEVNLPGSYTVTVTKPDGCALSKTLEVLGDFAPPPVSINANTKICEFDTLILNVKDPIPGVMYSWTMPDGMVANSLSLSTPLNGDFKLSATGANGCDTQIIYRVNYQFKSPHLLAFDSIINCTHPQIRLPVTSIDGDLVINVTGPGGYRANTLDTLIDRAGVYTITATNGGNCTESKRITIQADFQKPQLTISPTAFGCMQDSLRITATVAPVSSQVSWSGPNNFYSDQVRPLVFEYGWYYAAAILPNGCEDRDSVYIGIIASNPKFKLNNDTISCDQDSALLVLDITSPPNTTFKWSGPNSYYSDQPQVKVGQPGKYWVKVISPGGCFTKRSAIVEDFTSPPKVEIIQDSINCFRDSALISIVDTSLYRDFWVITHQGDTVHRFAPFVTKSQGTFQIHVVNHFGCQLDTFVHIVPDEKLATITFDSFAITCNNPQVTLSLKSDEPITYYKWIFPDQSEHFEVNPITINPGNYTVETAGKNGCRQVSNFIVSQHNLTPRVDLPDSSYSCKEAQLTLSYATDAEVISTLWRGPLQFNSSEKSPTVSVTGKYFLTITDKYGCTAIDSMLLTLSDALPSLSVTDDTLTCSKPLLVIYPQSNAGNPVFTWTDPLGNILSADSLVASNAGQYFLSVIDSNFCVVRDTFGLIADTLRPLIILNDHYILNCADSNLILNHASGSYKDIKWLQSGIGVISTDTSVVIASPGDYQFILTGQNGCISSRSFSVISDFQRPLLNAHGGNIDCINSKVRLIAQTDIPGSELIWDIEGTLIHDSVYVVNKPGLYSISVISPNGCRKDSIVQVLLDTLTPRLITPDGSLTCDSIDFVLRSEVFPVGGKYGWFGPNNFYSDLPHPRIYDTGTYYLFYNSPGGCLSVDTITIDDQPQHPIFTLSVDSITCYSPEVPISYLSSSFIEKFIWNGPDGRISTDSVFQVTGSGIVYATLYGDNGCATIDSIFVPIDTLSPLSSFSFIDSIYCEHREIKLFGVEPPPGEDYSYYWTTQGGNLISSDSLRDIWVQDIGSYILVTTNERNGCTELYAENINEKPNRLKEIQADVQSADCIGINNGSILITGTPGSHGEMKYSLYNDYYDPNTFFNKLKPGIFIFKGIDTAGCYVEDTIVLPQADTFSVTLRNDTIISLGQPIDIVATFEPSNSVIDQIIWTGAPSSCINCTQFTDYPIGTISYIVDAISDRGCIAHAEQRVSVRSSDNIFVPNVFTPNGDGKNDKVEISINSSVDAILMFYIYDRWGNQVYGAANFTPDQIPIGWEGDFQGKPCNPAVFVYFIQYRLTDGKILVKKGDITLLR